MTPWYPSAAQHLLANHYSLGTAGQRNTIVLHITEGPTALSAINTFEASKAPNRASAHFVIDRDGSITQLVSIENSAWHASQCNSHSIGIEHAAMTKTMPATEAQYTASSKLVAWLCAQLNIACDRDHIRTHNEASPRDKHVLCCTGALDPDRIVSEAAALMTPSGLKT